MSTTNFDNINRACGQVHKARQRAWGQFCVLNNNPLHKQQELIFLGLDLDTLHEV